MKKLFSPIFPETNSFKLNYPLCDLHRARHRIFMILIRIISLIELDSESRSYCFASNYIQIYEYICIRVYRGRIVLLTMNFLAMYPKQSIHVFNNYTTRCKICCVRYEKFERFECWCAAFNYSG